MAEAGSSAELGNVQHHQKGKKKLPTGSFFPRVLYPPKMLSRQSKPYYCLEDWLVFYRELVFTLDDPITISQKYTRLLLMRTELFWLANYIPQYRDRVFQFLLSLILQQLAKIEREDKKGYKVFLEKLMMISLGFQVLQRATFLQKDKSEDQDTEADYSSYAEALLHYRFLALNAANTKASEKKSHEEILVCALLDRNYR